MNTIRVENFRSIEDSGVVDIAPITAIVGRNSAGKSSFIRLFPLIKQTVEKRIAESMLWYGDYVDFGEFEQVVGKKNKNKPIIMSFSFDVEPLGFLYYHSVVNSDYRFTANVKVAILKNHFEYIKINIEDQNIVIQFNEDSTINQIYINGDDKIFSKFDVIWHRQAGKLFPTIFLGLKEQQNSKKYLERFETNFLREKVDKLIMGNKFQKSEIGLYRQRSSDIRMGSMEYVLSQLKEKNKTKYGKMTIKNKKFIECNNYILASNISFLLESINDSISSDMANTSYVKPIRAMVDRYYRVQGISIDEIDADGSNLPMILHNMSKTDLKNFELWCKEKFDVVFSVDSSQGHISLVIKEDLNSKEVTNLADTGYGYSQMLPIVVLLWMFHNKPIHLRSALTKTIVIEQPELHLHPAYQAKMIDVFVNILKEARGRNIRLKIIFETHSETMINRLGTLIASNKLEYQSVNILFFDKENDITTIKSKKFNNKGLLTGWPIGFFAADEVR